MRVYLVRHGQTAWNAERKNQGHTDIPLDDQGLEQAQLLAKALQAESFTRILSSDLMRAQQTADPLATKRGLEVEIRTDLRERSFGKWEAQFMEKVADNFAQLELRTGQPREEIRPPDGESMLDVWLRLESVAAEIESATDPIVVICHGGSGTLLLSRLLKGSVSTARSFRLDNAGITTVIKRPDVGFHLIGYNDTSHLRSPALSGSVDGTIR